MEEQLEQISKEAHCWLCGRIPSEVKREILALPEELRGELLNTLSELGSHLFIEVAKGYVPICYICNEILNSHFFKTYELEIDEPEDIIQTIINALKPHSRKRN